MLSHPILILEPRWRPKMHHVNDCQNLGRSSEGRNPVVQTLWSLRGHLAQFAHFSHLSKRQSPDAQSLFSIFLTRLTRFSPMPAAYSALLCACPLQPRPSLPDWGKATEAGVMSTAKFILLLGHTGSRERKNSLQSWEKGTTVW